MIPDMPDRVSDSGPDSHDSREDMDCYDCLSAASDEVRTACRAGRSAERFEAIRRAQDLLTNAASLAEAEILFRWQSIGRNVIVPAEVAPAADYLRDLARDMRALGWRMENGRYVRPEPPMWRKP